MKKYLLIVLLIAILSVATAGVASAQGGGNVHYVQFGETLYSVALKYGVSAQSIMGHNGLTNPDMIYVGQPLIIPGAYNNDTMGYTPGPTAYGCASYHVVMAGETLSDIAYNNGTSLQALMQQNNLYNGDLVYVGQKICLPVTPGYKPQPASFQQSYSPPADAYYHTVAGGETLHVIAARYSVSYLEIMQANSLNNAGFIRAGQKLYIPGYKPVPLPSKPVPPPLPESAPGEGGYEVFGYEQHSYREYHGETPAAPPPVPYAAPPYAPKYGGGSFDETHGSVGTPPPAPGHQPSPVAPILPEADHPIEVVVNGGVNWVGISDTIADPNSITTLIVQTGDEYGLPVRIRSGDYEVKGESDVVFLGEFGPFRFVFRHIPPGDYDVWIDDPERESEVVKVSVNPGDRVEIIFDEGVSQSGPTFASPDGWVLSSWDNPSKPKLNLGGWSNILVKTPASGLWVKIESEGGGYQAKCFTGSKGPGNCDFAGLTAGLYWIWIDGTGLTVKTYMDGNAYAIFEFARQPSPSADPNAVGPVDYSHHN